MRNLKTIEEARRKSLNDYLDTRRGERFADEYFGDEEAFAEMIEGQVRLERALVKHFNKEINEIDRMITVRGVKEWLRDREYWRVREQILAGVIEKYMDKAHEYGASTAEQELEITSDELGGERSQDTKRTSTRHAKSIEKTSRRLIRKGLDRWEAEQEIAEGFLEGLKQRVKSIFKVDRRAEDISDTETVNFFMVGKVWAVSFFLKFYKNLVIRKRWRSKRDKRTCSYCLVNDEMGWVRWSKKYVTPLGMIGEPPAHPLCRCYLGVKNIFRKK